jgi:hypothetical protein
MRSRGFERFAPLAGVVFFVLIALVFILSGDQPSADDKTIDAVSYWTKHDGRQIAVAAIGALAALFLVWFAGSVRSTLLRAEGREGRLSTLAFAGAVIGAVGLLIFSGIGFTAADSAGDVPPTVTQTLSALNADFFFPAAAGFALFLFATGLAALRTGALPAWLAWASIVIAVASVTPAGFIGFLASLVWVLVLSGLLFMRGETSPVAQPVD